MAQPASSTWIRANRRGAELLLLLELTSPREVYHNGHATVKETILTPWSDGSLPRSGHLDLPPHALKPLTRYGPGPITRDVGTPACSKEPSQRSPSGRSSIRSISTPTKMYSLLSSSLCFTSSQSFVKRVLRGGQWVQGPENRPPPPHCPSGSSDTMIRSAISRKIISLNATYGRGPRSPSWRVRTDTVSSSTSLSPTTSM